MSCRSTPGNSAITSYAQACTGLDEKEVSKAFHDLKREGANVDAPAQQEVEDFLSTQEFRVRNDERLPETRRESIVRRLRSALQQVREGILPDAGTFHAWKNVVAEAWQRARKKVVAASLIGAISFGVVGCGNTAPDHSANAPADTGPVATAPSVAPSQQPAAGTNVAPAVFTGPAVEQHGQDSVQSAYRTAATLAGDRSLNERVLSTSSPTEADLIGDAKSYMTNDCFNDYQGSVSRVVKGTAAGNDNASVNLLQGYGVVAGPATARKDAPLVSNRSVSQGKVSVVDANRINVTVTSKADFNINLDGKPVTITHTKVITYTMVKGTDSARPWLVDGYTGQISNGTPVPAKANAA